MHVRKKILYLTEKLSVLNKLEEKIDTQKDLAERYGISVATISRIFTNRAKLMPLASTTHNLQRKIKRYGKAPDVDESLFKWFRCAASVRDIPVSGYILRDKASSFVENISVE